MPFSLPNDASPSEVSEAINYLLANFGPNLSADPTSGQISGPGGNTIAYLYKYIAVKYADSFDGSVNFGDSPTNKAYYGLRNSDDIVESTNSADYIWYKVAGGGFGTTKFLFYQTSGGRQIQFVVATAAPNYNYIQENTVSIDLDVITSGKGQQIAYPTIYQWTGSSTPPTRPSTTTTFTWATGTYTAPSGWTTTPASNTTPGNYLWAITVPLSASVNVTTSVCDWTNTSYAIYNLAYNGTNGTSGTAGNNGLSAITAYRSQSQSASTPTFTTPTSGATIPSGWVGTTPSVSVGDVLWYIQGLYNSSAVTINGIAPNTTAWTGPIAASVFQDIRSDNWNGSNPPIVGNPATWGTAGYYIERSSGSTYLNNLFARGTLQSGTTPAISGTTMTGSGGVINSTGTFALGNPTTNISFNGTQMTLNGNVVATSNINNNAVTSTQAQYVTSSTTLPTITSNSILFPAGANTVYVTFPSSVSTIYSVPSFPTGSTEINALAVTMSLRASFNVIPPSGVTMFAGAQVIVSFIIDGDIRYTNYIGDVDTSGSFIPSTISPGYQFLDTVLSNNPADIRIVISSINGLFNSPSTAYRTAQLQIKILPEVSGTYGGPAAEQGTQIYAIGFKR
jgi:hypothetical protein